MVVIIDSQCDLVKRAGEDLQCDTGLQEQDVQLNLCPEGTKEREQSVGHTSDSTSEQVRTHSTFNESHCFTAGLTQSTGRRWASYPHQYSEPH